MQHEHKHSFKQIFRDRGYYIVLGLCVAAIGISGFLFSKSMKSASVQPSVSQQVLADAPSVTVPAVTQAEKKTEKSVKKAQEVLGTVTPQPDNTPSVAAKLQTALPIDGEVLQAYSMEQLAFNSTTKDWRVHDGIDYAAQTGAKVLAAADGTVEAVFCDDFYGQTVTVRHAGGYLTQYANLAEEVLVTVGQTVKMGDPLGSIGQTALVEIAAQPHLHFAVYCGDLSVDPAEFFAR